MSTTHHEMAARTPRPHDRACARCGYGVAAGRAPDACPMCGAREFVARRERRHHDAEAPRLKLSR